MKKRALPQLIHPLFTCAIISFRAAAQSYSLDWLTLTGPGGTTTGGTYSASVTVGQPAASAGTSGGSYSLTAGFWSLSVTSPAVVVGPGLSVSPADVRFFSCGPEGGPFTPVSQNYILGNGSTNSLNWTAVPNDNFLIAVSPTAGTLAPGATASVTVTINTDYANRLPPNASDCQLGGWYVARVFFTNTTSGAGNTFRDTALSIYSGLSVSPGAGLIARGTAGGPFSPTSQAYELRNIGNASALNWSASISSAGPIFAPSVFSNAISLSSIAGALAPGASTTVVVSINTNANQLPAGDYSAQIFFANTTDGRGNAYRNVALDIDDGLTLFPTNGFAAAGPVGGPFSNVGQGGPIYQLTNSTGEPLAWTLGHAPNWINLSVTSGTLAPGAAQLVELSLSAAANGLTAGHYSDVVSFRNLSNTRDVTELPVSIAVGSGPLLITSQPGHYTVSPGGSVTFGVSATGPEPIGYQWFHYGIDGGSERILGANASTLVLTNISQSQAGGYQMIVNNAETNLYSALGTLGVVSLHYGNLGFFGQSTIELYGAPGDVYQIDYKDSLGANSWTPFQRVTASGTFTDFSPSPQGRFYRAVYVPPLGP